MKNHEAYENIKLKRRNVQNNKLYKKTYFIFFNFFQLELIEIVAVVISLSVIYRKTGFDYLH